MDRRHHHPPIGLEAARVADEQLERALSELHRADTSRGDTVHEARRHIRKVRALLLLLRPRLTDEAYLEANRRLRALNRRLAPIATAPTVLGTLTRLSGRVDAKEARAAIEAVKAALVHRAERAERTAASVRLLKRAETTLAVERARIGTWEIEKQRLPIAAGLESSRRQAAKAMIRAAARPGAGRDRTWRRSTTRLWLHVRLLEPYRRELRDVRRRLDALDRCLDESHNVLVLERMLVTEGLVSRRDTAAALRLLRHYQSELRALAVVRGRKALRPARRRDRSHAGRLS